MNVLQFKTCKVLVLIYKENLYITTLKKKYKKGNISWKLVWSQERSCRGTKVVWWHDYSKHPNKIPIKGQLYICSHTLKKF